MLKITSKENPAIKNVIKLKSSAKRRKEQSLFIAEGLRLCYDAFISKAEITSTFVTEQAMSKYSEKIEQIKAVSTDFYIVDEKIFSLISDTKTPQGVICVIKILDKSNSFDTMNYNGKLLALDNVSDPQNLGTILRTAEAFGIKGVILSEGCCDIYSPKVVRGSMGAIFRVPFIITDDLPSFIRSSHCASYAAVLDEKSVSVKEISFEENSIVVIGNEANGITAETLKACDKSVIIPMSGRAESLNAAVAASILMWEMVK
ncbi:MAG: TrmH family RNA methyltransferase [Acutalibacteraceae bacterium]